MRHEGSPVTPAMDGSARVTMALALVTLIYGWYVAYRYIKLRRAHVSSATAQATAGLPVAASELPSGIASALEKLARLHRDGAINDDEFVAAKRRLLDT